MEDLRFKDGQKLRAIIWSHKVIRAEDGVEIQIVMENGQTACCVPWALVTYPDGSQEKWNLANSDVGVLL